MIIAHPWLLFLLIGLFPLSIWVFKKRKKAKWVFSNISLFSNSKPTLRVKLSRLPDIFKLISIAVLLIALARPQKGNETQPVIRQGIAIMMTLDRSSSMSQQDFIYENRQFDRFSVAKQAFNDFIIGSDHFTGRPDDLVGMIAFARWADTHCPLTLDHDMIGELLEHTHVVTERYEDGTAIGEAIAAACEKLKRTETFPHPPRSKVIVLLTDGQETVSNQIEGTITPRQARDLAKSLGIKIYTIGVAPDMSYRKNGGGIFGGLMLMQQLHSDVDEKLLKELADSTGGRYFRAKDGEGLRDVMENINELEKTRIEDRRFTEYSEHFLPFTFFSMTALCLSFIFGGTILRREI